MIDFGKAILIAMKTGKLVFGSENAIEAARSGKARMVVVASNCPEDTKSSIKAFAELSKIPVYEYGGSSVDLGLLCQKPFVVAAITVRDPGDSEIMKLVQT